MIVAGVVDVVPLNPPPIVCGGPGSDFEVPNGFGSNVGIRIGNYSPFAWKVSGASNDQQSQYVISPYTMNVYLFNNIRGPITLTAFPIATDMSFFPPNMHLSLEFTDDSGQLHGVYPANLGGMNVTTISQGEPVPGGAAASPVPICISCVNLPPGESIPVTIVGGGDSVLSILAEEEQAHGYDDDASFGGTWTYTDISFDVPSDPAYNYFVEWDINGVASFNTNDIGYDYQMFAQILGQSPGAGFEAWGFRTSGGITDPSIELWASGHGHRIEQVTFANYGTTISLYVYSHIHTHAPTRIRHSDVYSAKLIQIPV